MREREKLHVGEGEGERGGGREGGRERERERSVHVDKDK